MLDSVLIIDSPKLDTATLQAAFEGVLGSGSEVLLIEDPAKSEIELQQRVGRRLLVIPADLIENPSSNVLKHLAESGHSLPLIAVAQHGDVESAARAIEAGAADFLVMGERLGERIKTLLGKLKGLFEAIDHNRLLAERNAQLRESIQARFEIVGESPQVRGLIDQIRQVATVPRPVLIVGERGTGKELVARAIHFTSAASSGPIITVNCAAFNDSLLESELFGHERGAFTGADTTRQGRFEQADGGTLFLDEIGNMSLTFQQKILRVVEYGVFNRVGGMNELKSNARVIAATNSDLEEKMRQGEFLPDLYDRLAFEVVRVPSLRERERDITVLAHHFANQFEREVPAFRGKRFSKAALAELNRYPFPGNIRELKNVIERAVYRETHDEITPGDLGLVSPDSLLHRTGSFRDKVDAFSRQLLTDALKQTAGNQAEAARQLGLSYHQFRYYYGKYLKVESKS